MKGIRTIVLLLIVIFHSEGYADLQKTLTLDDAISLALKNNLSLKVEKLNTDMAGAGILVSEGEFDPVFGVEVFKTWLKSQFPSRAVISTDQRAVDFNTFLEGKFVTGTEYELMWTNERFRGSSRDLDINPFYNAELKLTLTQPLLKGFGISVQKAQIHESINVAKIADFDFSGAAEEVLLKTIESYWDVVAARSRLEVAELSLRLNQNIHEEVKAKIEAGVLASVEIYNSEAEVAKAEELVINKEKDLRDALDALRNVLNFPDWSLAIEAIDAPPDPEPLPSLNESIERALKLRNDYKSALLDKQNKTILFAFHKNQRLPELNIFGNIGINSSEEDYSEVLDTLGSQDFYSWEVGISLTIPIGNNLAVGNFRRAQYELEQSKERLKELENTIKIEIRQGWRTLELARKEIDVKEKILRASKKRFEAEEGRFRVGLATLNDVFQFQEDYVQSLADAKVSKIVYAIAYADFRKMQGDLLNSLSIVLN